MDRIFPRYRSRDLAGRLDPCAGSRGPCRRDSDERPGACSRRRGPRDPRGPARTRRAPTRAGSQSRAHSAARCWTHPRSRASLAREPGLARSRTRASRRGASPLDDSISWVSGRKPGPGISRPFLGSDGSVVRNARIGPRSGANGHIGGDRGAGSSVARRKQDSRSRTRGAGESGWRSWRPAREYVEHPGLPALEFARIGRPRRGSAVAADGPAARPGLPGRRPRRACGSPPQPTPESRRGPRPALRARPDRSLPGSSATSDTPRTWGRGATVGRETSQESEEARPSNRVA